jgi:hypothetical protein
MPMSPVVPGTGTASMRRGEVLLVWIFGMVFSSLSSGRRGPAGVPAAQAAEIDVPMLPEHLPHMEILKHGSHVEVLEPAWLRKKVVKEIRETGKKYRG